MARKTSAVQSNEVAGGFGAVDSKGRISIPADVRKAIGLQAGSAVAYIALADAVLVVPQDEHLAELSRRAINALADAGLTVQDVLDVLPSVRQEIFVEAYGAEFVREIEELHKRAHTSDGA